MWKKTECIEKLSTDQGSSLLQFATTISLCFSQLGSGCLLAWSSPSLQHLMSEKSEFSVTSKQGAWITSLSNVGFIIGYLIIPLLMDKIGRKYTLLFFAIPQIASWILITFAKNVFTLFLARIIGGIGYSCAGLISIYVAEITERKIRGMFSILILVSSELGMLLVATMGAYFSYNTMNSVLISLPLIFFVSFIFMPESPYFYLMQKEREMAVKSLMRLRGVKDSELIFGEIESMKRVVNEERDSKKNSWRELFVNRSNRKGFAIVIFAHLTSMFSGTLVVIAYAQQIFQVTGFSLTPEHSYMLLIIVKVIAGLVASQLIERLGRRFLYVTSGILSSLSLASVSLFFFLKIHFQNGSKFVNLSPLINLIIYEIVSTLGISSLPFVFGGEFFLISFKKLAITVTFVASSVATFGVELMFPMLNESVGIYVSFLLFSVFCLIGTLYNYSVMPETKGKSLEEIQDLLKSTKTEDSEVRLRLLTSRANDYGTESS